MALPIVPPTRDYFASAQPRLDEPRGFSRILWNMLAGTLTLSYIGPGAGIAVLGSFLAVLAALASALLAMLLWPIRWIIRLLRGRRVATDAKVKRVVVVGLDGLEPTITDRLLDEGVLPNLAKLRDQGTYARLATTCPPLSPVAWSSFSTGVNPGKHHIFDFITRNPADYLPRISSMRIDPPPRKVHIGRWVIPLSKPRMVALRKSKPFWTVLGEHNVFSAVIRVPITFPPDKFHGVQLGAMCIPDLRGTQGMFTWFSEIDDPGVTTDTSGGGDVGGQRCRATRSGDKWTMDLPGPDNGFRADGKPTTVRITVTRKGVLKVGDQRVQLTPGTFTPWVRVTFNMLGPVKASGLVRFHLKSFEPFELYCTPINIDPDKPVMPIAHPRVYSTYLARKLGPFATLGLAEDTWVLSEGLLGDDAFLTQAYDIHAEREAQLDDALDKVRRGMVACVFDAPDRIQHMFTREPQHDALREMYIRMDETVGRVRDKLDDDDALIVMSDHGFKPFRRGVDLNAWLLGEGYLTLKDGAAASGRQYLADVDWGNTKAYAIGLAGIFINLKGREAHGTVETAEYETLVAEITGKLTGLQDGDATAVHEAIPRGRAYRGPYVDDAPDIIVGYAVGWRVSWDAAVGKTTEAVFADNTKAWSGDHCVHPSLVPGVLFSNLKLRGEGAAIIDIAPTCLDLLGVETPGYMDGKTLLCDDDDSFNSPSPA